MAEKTELQQTKGTFKFIGKVTRIDKDGAWKDETATGGQNEGKRFRSLRFGVKTSPTNEMTVNMFDYQPEEVHLWNSDDAKKAKEKGEKYKGIKVDFTKWYKERDKYREDGYAILQTRIGLTHGEDGKLESQGLPSFIASKMIYDSLNNGDAIVVEGDTRYSKYKNRQDKMVEQKSYGIKRLFLLKELDFDKEDFEEITYFEQQMVFVDAVDEKKDKKVFVTGRIIDYKKNFHDTQFVVDYSDGNGEVDEDMKKLADAFTKKFKFGDVLTVFGDTVNRVVTAQVETKKEDKNDDDFLSSIGGKKKPSHAEGFTSREYVIESLIHGVDAYDKKVYKESDFQRDDLLANDEEDFGGKKNKGKANPFSLDEEDGKEIDIDDSDLPF